MAETVAVQFSEVDPALVDGVSEGNLSNPGAGVAEVNFPLVAGARNLNLALDLATNRGLRGNAAVAGTDYQQAWTTIGSSPEAVGYLLTTTAVIDGADRIVPMAVWYDTATGRGVAGPGLIKLDAWPDFVEQVLDNRPADADPTLITEAMQAQAAPYGEGPAIGFDSAGDLVVQFGSHVLDEPIMIEAGTASSMLSPFGADAQASASSPSEFSADAEVDERDRSDSVGGEDNLAAGATGDEQPEVIEIPEGPGGAGGSGEDDAEPSIDVGPRPYPWVGVNCEALECVAMTYDDGPGPRTDEVSLAYLNNGQAVTYFALGNAMQQTPEGASLVAARGMELGSHTVTHEDLRHLSDKRREQEFAQSAALLEEASGRPPLFMRAPFGAVDEEVRKVAKKHDMAIVSWTVDTRDWETKNAGSTLTQASAAKNQAVVLMHDIQDSSVDAAPQVVQGLVDRGVVSVTVGELSDYDWRAGEVYPEGAYGSA
ncbi:polysaccharide deacetylase family protein [Naumannella halotolerans]|uniref:polysaccharide deacetylase family protein n=1 Tax=Naumannella halotolerans TaxID=993414 RepID=UPI00370D0131